MDGRGSKTASRIALFVVILLAIAMVIPASAGDVCDPGTPGCLPTPEECATGDYNGLWPGRGLTHAAICVGAGGQSVVYVGGEAIGRCLEVVIAGQTVNDVAVDPNYCNGGPIPEGAVWTETTFPSGDGTPLHADLFRPGGVAPNVKTPVILLASPYFTTGGVNFPAQSRPPFYPSYYAVMFNEAIARGYTIVNVSLRGFGSSGGCGDLGGRGERMDVKAGVEWAASQPWSSGKVGMWGLSYDGWTQVMALAEKPAGLAAAVIQAPVIDFYTTVFMNGNRYQYATVVPLAYALTDLYPPSIYAGPEQILTHLVGVANNPACYAKNLVETNIPDPTRPYWKERDLVPAASGSLVPVLWSHGFLDQAVMPTNFLDLWTQLDGPKRAWFGQYRHTSADAAERGFPELLGKSGFLAEAMRWLDCYVADDASQCAAIGGEPPVVVQRHDGVWRAEAAWPPLDAASQPLLSLLPGSYRDLPGNDAEARQSGISGVGVNRPALPNGTGTWTFTQPLPYDLHFAGVPSLSVTVKTVLPGVNLVALLYDVDEQGFATFVSRGAYVVSNSGTIEFDLFPQDWRLKAGHRVGVLISGADDSWFTPGVTGTTVQVLGGTLSLPFLSLDRVDTLPGGPSSAVLTRGPFEVPAATITERTMTATLPPPMS